jgi:hypothetical protein
MTEAAEGLLRAVLAGQWPVPDSLRWALSDGAHPPPPGFGALPAQNKIESDTQEGEDCSPAAFRASLLSFVRDQAEFILAATEADASASRHGTPRSQDRPAAAAAEEAAGRAAAARAVQHSSLQRVARRLEPGTVDDLNFPALAAAPPARPAAARHAPAAEAVEVALAAVYGGSSNAQPPARPVMIPPQRAQQLAAAVAAQGCGGDNPRRRIVPTMVPEAEASEPFLNADLTPLRSGEGRCPPKRAEIGLGRAKTVDNLSLRETSSCQTQFQTPCTSHACFPC